METPEGLKPHVGDYQEDSWKWYTLSMLGAAVAFFVERSRQRTTKAKRDKDLYDARNYLDMMEAHIRRAEELSSKVPR